MATSRGRNWAMALGVNVLAIGGLIGAVEALIVVMMRHPPGSGALRRLAGAYYMTLDRNII
jgi:hypothetical protein